MAKRRLGQVVSPKLLEVAKRARVDPSYRFLTLAYLLDEQALARSFKRIRKDAAKGVDGLTKEQYGADLGARLQDLHQRMKAGRYRHQPIRRVLIPKGAGKYRPIGVSTIEDKVVQGALREVLEAIYEQDFRKCSYGFRPGRSAHHALRAVNKMSFTGNIAWILEADIRSFFDSLDRANRAVGYRSCAPASCWRAQFVESCDPFARLGRRELCAPLPQLNAALGALDHELPSATVAELELLVSADAIAGTPYDAGQRKHLDSER